MWDINNKKLQRDLNLYNSPNQKLEFFTFFCDLYYPLIVSSF